MKEAVLGKTAYGVSTLHPVSLTQYSYKNLDRMHKTAI